MREDTIKEFFAKCEIEHDEFCAEGAGCDSRDLHIYKAYLPEAMANEINRLRDQ